MNKSLQLDVQKVLALLDEGGKLGCRLKNFEKRDGQREILAKIVEAFNDNAIGLIEAGTGTGKSMAYLIPALLSIVLWKEKVVVSTHTIALQEQLMHKDLPFLMQALGIEIKAVLVKGMNNYVCLRKCDEAAFEKKSLPDDDQKILDQMEDLIRQGIGARSDFPFHPPAYLWEWVEADHDTCNSSQCPHYGDCSYINARKNAQNAQLLIVNHHLLLADLALKGDSNRPTAQSLLPPYQRLIMDEAHHLEEIATGFFAKKVSRFELFKTFSKISSERQGKESGKIALLKDKLLKSYPEGLESVPASLLNLLNLHLPALHDSLLKDTSELFSKLENFLETYVDHLLEEPKLRLRAEHYTKKAWTEEVLISGNKLIGSLNRHAFELSRLDYEIEALKIPRLSESVKGIVFDLKSLSEKMEKEALLLENFLSYPPQASTIRWLESVLSKRGVNLTCIDASLDVSELLYKNLCEPLETAIFLSATLSAKGSFDYIKERFGLSETAVGTRKLIESSVDSPFDYSRQALLVVPKDMPAPTAPNFLEVAQEAIMDAIQASRGNAFILFTSYTALQKCFWGLEQKLKDQRFKMLKQGDDQRKNLLKRFMENDRSVLFGTDSFWEGVDVAGEALRLVVIVKLPFKVPTDPLIQARSEALKEAGKEPFYEFLLPQAAIKFKQGFGRLIRNKSDRGCILCLDNRLISKNYGKYFIKTLPQCPCEIVDRSSLKDKMKNFYKKTDPKNVDRKIC